MFKHRILPLFAACAVFLTACVKGNEFVPQYNQPEGVFIYGPGTQFSLQTENGKFRNMDDPRLSSITTWLTAGEEIFFSKIADGHKEYVFGARSTRDDNGVLVVNLEKGASAMKVARTGLYKIIYSRSLGCLSFIPVTIEIVGKEAMTAEGSNVIAFLEPEYDRVNHIVTWASSNQQELILSGEYKFRYYGDGSYDVPLTPFSVYPVKTMLTGIEASSKTNVLSDVRMPLTTDSEVNLKLKKKGNYVVRALFDVKEAEFFATIEGEEIVIPEPTGQPENLWMDLVGSKVQMTPCGAVGNGVFWTLAYIPGGLGVKFSTDETFAQTFCSLDTNAGIQVSSDVAVPLHTGANLVFVDLYNKVVSMSEPELYAMGDCFEGADVPLVGLADVYSATTTAEGDLRMYAVCPFNERDWDSMEFGVRAGKILYRGIGEELIHTPVAAGVPVVIDFPAGEADLKVTMSTEVPFNGKVYMLTSCYGDMNWGNPEDIITLNKVWNDDTRWIYVRYFTAGSKFRFTTEASPVFGRGEFVGLDTNTGYVVENGYAVIEKSGAYGIIVNLGGRKVSIEPLTMYTYGTASADQYGTKLNDPFTVTENDKVHTYTVANDGRLRLNPVIGGFDFSSWQREFYVDLETLELKQRKAGEDEPNASYTWAAGTVINIDFETLICEIK